ncbi:MAG: thioredoxin family protein [Elusimicrobia bacterium]|nr:thioredoxin family protein [Elusimicrobiota bacterium]
MMMTVSTMLPLGTQAPDFDLPDVTTGKRLSLRSFSGSQALVVMFICRHCPYVQNVRGELARLAKDYSGRGAGFVGISSNDPSEYPEDAPDQLKAFAGENGFPFPLLFDESQETAKVYTASCTPDFFLFDAQRRLVYRGQLDDSRPGNGRPVTGADLRAALDAALAGRPVAADQKPSAGCNIKWKPGREPDYFK